MKIDMSRFISIFSVSVLLGLVSCTEMLNTQRVALEIPERQNWNGGALYGDIERIEAKSYELEGQLGFEHNGELLSQTTTEFNLRGDVVSVVYVGDSMVDDESYTYDKSGRLVGKVVNYGFTRDEHRYKLDNYGCVVVDEFYSDEGMLDSSVAISYDRAGNDIQHISTDRFGNTRFVQDRVYDENNNCTEFIFSNGDDQVRQRETFVYDDLGRKVSFALYEGYDVLKSRVEYNYSDDEMVSTVFDSAGDMFSKSVERYDAAGRVVELVSYNCDDVVVSKCVTTYDEQGRVVEVRTTDGGDELLSTKSYEYDANGCCVKRTEEDKQASSLTVVLYSYDEHKNLVKERCYMGNYLVAQYVIEYDLVYRGAAAETEIVAVEQVNAQIEQSTDAPADEQADAPIDAQVDVSAK